MSSTQILQRERPSCHSVWCIWHRSGSCPHAEVQHEDGLSVWPTQLQEFKRVNQEMQILISATHKGLPLSQKECPAKLVPYYDSRSELVEDSGLVCCRERLVVPHLLWDDMFKEIHRLHIGIGGCLRRARELLYWPRINAEVRHYVSKCSVCQTYQPEQCWEELQPHAVPNRPWSKVGAHIFELESEQFLIMVDYWSNYFEVQELKRVTLANVIHVFKVQFARHGILEIIVTDNGTQ